jgi:hypothetical protein
MVTGYRVYVGTTSRAYTEFYDVHGGTRFTYSGSAGVRYYFAISSYYPGPLLGPWSEEVSEYAGEVARAPTSGSASVLGPEQGAPSLLAPALAVGSSALTHTPKAALTAFTVKTLARSVGRVSALASLPTGDVLFVEGDRFLRMLSAGGLISDRILEIPDGRITGLAVDPTFERSGHVSIGIASGRAGSEQLSVVRYRLADGTLGEAAYIVTGLPVSNLLSAPLALDGRGHLYVALPALVNPRVGSSSPDGTILRFNTDGSTPSDNPALSPAFARGFERPTSLRWDASAQVLWLAGSETVAPEGSIAFLSLNTWNRHSPYPVPVPLKEDYVVGLIQSSTLTVMAPMGRLDLALLAPRPSRLLPWRPGTETPTAVDSTGAHQVVVALRRNDDPTRSRIVVLERPITGNP